MWIIEMFREYDTQGGTAESTQVLFALSSEHQVLDKLKNLKVGLKTQMVKEKDSYTVYIDDITKEVKGFRAYKLVKPSSDSIKFFCNLAN